MPTEEQNHAFCVWLTDHMRKIKTHAIELETLKVQLAKITDEINDARQRYEAVCHKINLHNANELTMKLEVIDQWVKLMTSYEKEQYPSLFDEAGGSG